jgi:competence ComEA-like helix-hairpin-helix protein
MKLWHLGAALVLSLVAPAAAGAQPLPDGPGKEITVKVCSQCHDVERVSQYKMTRDDWAAMVKSMFDFGADATPEDAAVITDYLATHFPAAPAGKINVNTATATELAGGLELMAAEATAIVDYRGKNGQYKVLDDLKQVPGLDFKKVEAKKDLIIF